MIFSRSFVSCFVFPLLKGQEALPGVPAAEPWGLPSPVTGTGAELLVQVTTLLLIQHPGSHPCIQPCGIALLHPPSLQGCLNLRWEKKRCIKWIKLTLRLLQTQRG